MVSTRQSVLLAAFGSSQFAEALQQHAVQVVGNGTKYGTSCPCIGIEGLTGNTAVVVDNTTYPDRYPAEIGSRCEAWDEGKYPGSCDGNNSADWCSQAWCYVDVDNCELEDGPYETHYLPYGQFRGHELYYSYLTCGSTNSYDFHQKQSKARKNSHANRELSLAEEEFWPFTGSQSDEKTDAQELKAEKKHEKKLAVATKGSSYGTEKCQCIGIEGLTGNTSVVVANITYPDRYPAEIGSRCEAWDEGKYPGSCDAKNPEDWCAQAWCYVDIDNCVLEDGPYESDYLPYADFHGHALHYSYLTCNGTNSYDLHKKQKKQKQQKH